MRVDELEQALRRAADDQPPVSADVDAVQAGGRRRQRMRSVGLAGVGVAVVIAIGASLVAWSGARDDEHLTTDALGGATGRWEQLPTPPLSPRRSVVGVWTGSEVLVVGGDTHLCPPGADCSGPTEPPLRDGAILDPTTETWRSIAPAPIPFSYASTAVAGDHVYFLLEGGSRAALLRYSLGDDEWKELAVPPGGDALHTLVAVGDRVVAYSGSDERGEVPDQVYDPGSESWSPLPADPLSPSFGRSMVWAEPYLYLFEHELVASPGSDGPSVTRGARLALGTDDWERLPDSEILGSGGWYAEGNLLVNPQLGGADGGEVGNYGRTYPYGGILDVETQTWIDLPDAPSEYSNGVIGDRGGWIYGNRGGLLLDLGSMRWIEMPALPGVGYDPYVSRFVVPAGRDAVSFGGEDWTETEGKVLGDAWIWRSPAAAGAGAATATTVDEPATTPTSEREPSEDCKAPRATDPVVGDHVLTVVPPEFSPDGEVVSTSTGFVDMGGESHDVQRFTDDRGRWIEFDSFGVESPAAYIDELFGATPQELVPITPCVFSDTGPQRVTLEVPIAAQDDRWILAVQEWEYGGYSIAAHPEVEVDDLIAIASGLARSARQ